MLTIDKIMWLDINNFAFDSIYVYKVPERAWQTFPSTIVNFISGFI